MAQNYQQHVKFTYKVVSSRQAWEGNQGWHLGACTLVPSKLRPIQRCWSTSNNQLLGASWPERWVNTELKYLRYFYVCKICLFTSWKYKIWVSSMNLIYEDSSLRAILINQALCMMIAHLWKFFYHVWSMLIMAFIMIPNREHKFGRWWNILKFLQRVFTHVDRGTRMSK